MLRDHKNYDTQSEKPKGYYNLRKGELCGYGLVMALLGATIGLSAGRIQGEYLATPESAYVIDVNGDGIKDLVARGPTGCQAVLLGQKDGTFKPLDGMTKAQQESVDAVVQAIESKAK